MLLPMLRAVKEMIVHYDGESLELYKARTQCASTVLTEIISTLETAPAVIEHPKQVSKEKTPGDKPTLEPPHPPKDPPPEVETTGDEWMITLDDKKGLVIKDFPLDGLVELDGKKMTYGEARGQTFKRARIL